MGVGAHGAAFHMSFVVLLHQCILNGDFNAQRDNDGCERQLWCSKTLLCNLIVKIYWIM